MSSRSSLNSLLGGAFVAGAALVAFGFAGREAGVPLQTPAELVATYDNIADIILAANKSEDNIVRSILALTHSHATGVMSSLRQTLKAGDAKAAKNGLEVLADLVGQLSTEGDNSVGKVRKRLLEGGHHHNAAGEAQGVYEEGYVVVTRAAKKTFLEASQAIGQLSRSPKIEDLEAQWAKVEETYAGLLKKK
jgi:hypothetical protein